MTARYSIIPSEAFTDKRLRPVDVRVLGVLGSFLNKNGEAWPSQRTIAEAAGLHRVTVNQSLKALVELGYVRTKERAASGMKVALLYRVVMELDERLALAGEQPELFPKDELAPRRKATKSDVANGNIGKGSKQGKAQQRQMLSTTTSQTSDVAPADYIDVVTADYIQRTYPENIQGSVSSLHSETGLTAEVEQDDLEGSSQQQAPVSASKSELQKSIVFETGKRLLVSQGLSEANARAFLGKQIKNSNLEIVARVISRAAADPPGEARSWITAAVGAEARKAGIRTAAEPAEPLDWKMVLRRWVETEAWPRAAGPRPNELGYRGPLDALEALLPEFDAGHPVARDIRRTIAARKRA